MANRVEDTSIKGGKTRRQKVESREGAIVAAAAEIFNDRGYGKTTISDIAKKSGVADGTVYLYFKNKEDIARGVLANFYTELTRSAQNGVDSLLTTADRLQFLAVHHLEQIIKNRRLLEMLPLTDLSMDQYEGSALYTMNKAYVAVFDRVAKDGLAQGHLRSNLQLWILRDIFFGAMDYGARTIVLTHKDENIDNFVADLLSLLLVSPYIDTSAHPAEQTITTRLEQAVLRLEKVVDKLERG